MPHVRSRSVQRDQELHLRRPSMRDCPRFLAATRASRSFHRPFIFPPTTEIAYRRWLAEGASERFERLLLWSDADNDIVGYFGINDIVWGSFRSAGLGYWINIRYAGRGYMTRGLHLVLAHAFGRVRLHRLEANAQPTNGRSLALLRRLGFRREGYSPRYVKLAGRWCDHERWALTVEDWREHRGRPAQPAQPAIALVGR